ncbi:MAG: TetR/AcrR family transcriptional regulator [Bacteroidaceae bacterium]|nr:TetR/AcrR family transcriptional regulator [Bacteroidaceae bacterium]
MIGKDNRSELYTRIVVVASELFRRQGIKRVTMDDVAHGLRMSKRTIYEIFREKEQLVTACVKYQRQEFQQQVELYQRQCSNVLESALHTLYYAMKQYAETSKQFFEDVSIYPQIKELIKQDRENRREASFEFFKLGVRQGIFIPDLDYNIIAILNENQTRMLVENASFKSYPITEVAETILMTFFRGIVTDKGRRILDKFYQDHHHQ